MIKSNQHAVNDIDRPPTKCSESGSGRLLDMIPLPGEASDGEEGLPFGPEEGFSLRPGFGMEEGSKKRNPSRDSIQRDGNRWGSNAREKERRGNLQPLSTRKGPRGNNRTNHQPQKYNSPPTSNMYCGINVASSLVFSLILSLRRLSTALWLSPLLRRFSFASRACLSPTSC